MDPGRGCGIGTCVRRFLAFSPHAHGIDVVVNRLQESPVSGLAAAGEQLPFGDGTFDPLVFNEVIEHVHNDRQTIQDALRVLACDDPTRDQPNVTSDAYLA